MKTLTKLALVSAMAISSSAMAMQAMDDESLSAATGQDGVTISLLGDVSMDYLAIVDGDGGPAAATLPGETGAIQIGDGTAASLKMSASNGINLIIDADGNGGAPVLNINADLGDTTIEGVNIYVAASDDTGATLTDAVSVLDVGTVTLDGLTANIQLGNQPQGTLIKLDSTITGGLVLSDLSLKQGANHGIGLGQVTVTSGTTGNLVLDLEIDATDNGLEIAGLTGMNIAADNLRLGNLTTAPNASLGALYIKNLNVGSSVAISGH